MVSVCGLWHQVCLAALCAFFFEERWLIYQGSSLMKASNTNSYREGSCRPNRLSTGNFYLISLQTAQISDDWLILTKRKKEKRHKQTPFVLLPLNQTVTMSPFLASTSLTFTPCHSCPALISLVASSFLLRLCMELYLADAFCLFIFSATFFFSRFFSAALCF